MFLCGYFYMDYFLFLGWNRETEVILAKLRLRNKYVSI